MSLSKWAGVVWLFAGLFSVVITIVFRTEQWQWIVTIIAGIAAAIMGVLLIWRPRGGTVTWSTAVGVGWLVIYVVLTVRQRDELVAWTTDVFIGAIGVVAALVAYRQKASGRQPA